MIPTPPPARRGYAPMHLEFAPIPAELARRIHVVSRALGLLSINATFAVLLVIVSVGLLLPTGISGKTILTVFMGGVSSSFSGFSGIALGRSPSYVRTGDLNVTYARQTRRQLLMFWIATIVPTGISVLLFASAADTDAWFTPAILGYWFLLWVPFTLSLIDMIVGMNLLKAAKQPPQTYTAMPQ